MSATVCSAPGCPNPTRGGPCPEHRRPAWQRSTPRPTTAGSGYARQRLRAAVFARDGYTCVLRLTGCTGRAEELDHVVSPLHRPDLASEPSNLRAACRHCNQSRGKQQATAGRAGQKFGPASISALMNNQEIGLYTSGAH